MQGRFSGVLGLVSLLGMLGTSMVFAATIDTPMTAVECQPLSLAWHNANPSGQVYISLVEGKNTGAQPLLAFTPQPGSVEGVLTWPKVNVTAGTQFTLIVNDASGVPNFSGQVNVQKGPESGTCGAIGSGTSAGGSTTPATGGSTAPVSSSTTTSPSTTPSSTSSSTTSSNTGSSTTTSSSGGSSSSSAAKPSSGTTTNSTSSTSKPASGTNGANVNAILYPATMASFALALGSFLAVNVL